MEICEWLDKSFVLCFIFVSNTFCNDFCNRLLVAFVVYFCHFCVVYYFLDSKDQETVED